LSVSGKMRFGTFNNEFIMTVTKTPWLAAGALTLALAACTAQDAADAGKAGFRDLNRNGQLDPYENAALDTEARTEDLLARMTLDEKIGTLLHGTLVSDDPIGISGNGYNLEAVKELIHARHLTSFITRLGVDARTLAEQNNAVQALAEHTRLGIPVTISTDPRNHFKLIAGASTHTTDASQWPEVNGFGALADADLVRQFADYARQEYRALGIHMALSPTADLSTEPRWSRSNATFGSDPALVSKLVGAYVEGFQGGPDGVRPDGVATVVKHWVGYGAQPDGFDGHSYYGRNANHDNETFAQHVAAFDGAFAARVAGVMPTYPIINGVSLNGQPLEAVGANFNRQLLTDLLRGEKQYTGLILSDWSVTDDCPERCRAPTADAPQRPQDIAMPWGVEDASEPERFAKAINAGVDQIGGTDDPAPLRAAIDAGLIDVARVDDAVRQVLLLKFQLGLFDNPYVDVDQATRIAANPDAHAAGLRAQAEAQVLLENRNGVLPIKQGSKVWLYQIDPALAAQRGLQVVEDVNDADIAVLRVSSPSELLHPYHFFGKIQDEGRLDFRAGDAGYDAIKRAAAVVPTVVVADLFRPAVLTNIREQVQGLVASFGSSDQAVLDVLVGALQAKGRLPFELPSSMQAVEKQDPAKPNDSENPLYPFGYGL